MLRGRAVFVIVGDEILLPGFSPVGTVETPIVDHIIAVIDQFLFRVSMVAAAAEARVPAGMVSEKVMMERRPHPPPDAAISMIAFMMIGMVQALADDAPLHGAVPVVADRQHLVNTPTKGAMIDDNIFLKIPAGCIFGKFVHISQADPEIADDDVVSINTQRVIPDADSIARRRLAGNGEVAVLNP